VGRSVLRVFVCARASRAGSWVSRIPRSVPKTLDQVTLERVQVILMTLALVLLLFGSERADARGCDLVGSSGTPTGTPTTVAPGETVGTGALAAGASYTLGSQTLTIPAETAEGSYFIGILAGGLCNVAESKENDNRVSTSISVRKENRHDFRTSRGRSMDADGRDSSAAATLGCIEVQTKCGLQKCAAAREDSVVWLVLAADSCPCREGTLVSPDVHPAGKDAGALAPP